MMSIDQFRYIKIQPKTIDLSTRLWGLSPTNSVFIPHSLVLRSIVSDWILIYRNWSICFFTITNCHIVRSRSLRHRLNYKFMCLSAYWQWKWANEHAKISAFIAKIEHCSTVLLFLQNVQVLNLRPVHVVSSVHIKDLSDPESIANTMNKIPPLPLFWLPECSQALFLPAPSVCAGLFAALSVLCELGQHGILFLKSWPCLM